MRSTVRPVNSFQSSTIAPLSAIAISAEVSARRYSASFCNFTKAGAAGTTSSPPLLDKESTASSTEPLKKRTPRMVSVVTNYKVGSRKEKM